MAKRIIRPTTVTKPKTAKQIGNTIRLNQQLKTIREPLKLSIEADVSKALENTAESLKNGRIKGQDNIIKELENILKQVREYV